MLWPQVTDHEETVPFGNPDNPSRGRRGRLRAQAPEARLLRFPAIHGSQIVFTYAGDLYTVPATGGLRAG